MSAPPEITPRLHVTRLWLEAWRSTRARPVAAVLILVLTAAMCFVSLATVGRSVAAEQQVSDELESAGARELVVANGGGLDLLGPTVVRLADSMTGVERAIGVGAPRDVVNSAVPTGDRGPMWGLSGDLEDAVVLEDGRWPRAGEALVAADAATFFGFAQPVGAVRDVRTGESIPVVGSYRPKAPFGDLNGVIISAPQQDARELRVVLADIGAAARVQEAVLGLLGDTGATQTSVSSPVKVADLHTSIVGTLDRFGSGLLALVLGMGAVLVAAVVAADTTMASVEWGRRRALGASRTQLVILATMRVGFAAVAGSVVGVLGAWAMALVQDWSVVPRFAFAVATLAALVALASALPPAVRAARRDPVAVLRTP